MPETNGKRTFYNNVRRQGSSLVVSIPPEIVKHLELEEGDEIAFQRENSSKIENQEHRKNGDYSSMWNETVQSGER